MKTYYVSFYKDPTITAEFRVRAVKRLEARQIAERAAMDLKGFRLMGVN